ncbi:hypothetical protein [Salmonella enterica]|uniref:hypothetical protein n=1 Tax=Salmonella enterica TaxID=28901 RepID=UPI000DED0C00|nr:hypothetical protein [Salmonella enterica]AXD91961.1 hypothetical protein CHE40_18755 [Salmonella enterica]
MQKDSKESIKSNLALSSIYFICYIFAYFSRINVSFAKLEMLADIQLSETAYGFGAGIFLLVM